jgi:cell division septal protein FtsQ
MFGERKEPTRRADQLRRRRTADEPQARTLNWQAGPVATRTSWEPRARRSEPRAYRMHNIPLSERGVEVQVPAISLSFSPRAGAVTIAAAMGFALLFLLTTRMFEAGTPVVQGVNYLSAESVADASGVDGVNLFLISADEINRTLPQHMPGVKQADLSVSWDGTVTIDIQERAPILMWEQGGSQYWVDAEGVIFPAQRPLDGLVSVRVPDHGPTLTMDGKPNILPEVVASALELTVALPAGSSIVYDSQNGLGMQDANGWPAYFGDSGNIPAKLAVYSGLVNNLMSRGIRPVYVNISDVRQPYYRRTIGGNG